MVKYLHCNFQIVQKNSTKYFPHSRFPLQCLSGFSFTKQNCIANMSVTIQYRHCCTNVHLSSDTFLPYGTTNARYSHSVFFQPSVQVGCLCNHSLSQHREVCFIANETSCPWPIWDKPPTKAVSKSGRSCRARGGGQYHLFP